MESELRIKRPQLHRYVKFYLFAFGQNLHTFSTVCIECFILNTSHFYLNDVMRSGNSAEESIKNMEIISTKAMDICSIYFVDRKNGFLLRTRRIRLEKILLPIFMRLLVPRVPVLLFHRRKRSSHRHVRLHHDRVKVLPAH